MFDISELLPSIIEAAKTSPYIIYIKSESDDFAYFNNSAKDVLDADLETIKTKTFVEGSKEKEIYDKLFANDIQVIREGVPKSDIYFLGDDNPLNKDSCYYFTKAPIKTEDNKNYLIGFGVEITNKLVENSTLNFFKKVLNSMTDAFIITDVEYPYTIRYANLAFVELSGHKDFSEVVGKAPTDVLQKLTAEKELRENFNQKLAEKKICDVVLTNRNAKGRVFKSHIKVIPLYHSNSDNPDFFVGIQRDITEKFQKQAIIDKKQAQLRAIFANISSYLWLVSADTKLVMEMNRAAQAQGKYLNAAYKLKLKFSEGRWWKASFDAPQEIEKAINHVLNTGRKHEITVDFLDASDNVRHVRLIINPNRDSTGKIDFLVIEGADVTDLEKERRQFETIAKSSVVDPNSVENWTKTGLEGKELERVVNTENAVSHLIPQVNRLEQDIRDPETGLIVRVGNIQEVVVDNKKTLNKLAESTEGFSTMMRVAGKIPTLLKNPIIKYLLIGLLGASAVNTFGQTFSKIIDFSHYFEQQVEHEPIINP